MNAPPLLSTWLDSLAAIALTTSMAVLVAMFFARWITSAAWQRALWQVCLVGLWLIIAAELCGAARWLSALVTGVTPVASVDAARKHVNDSAQQNSDHRRRSIAESLRWHDFSTINDLSATPIDRRGEDFTSRPPDPLMHGMAAPVDGDVTFAGASGSSDVLGVGRAKDSRPPTRIDATAAEWQSGSTSETAVVSAPAKAPPGVWWPGWLWCGGTTLVMLRMLSSRLRLLRYCRSTAEEIDADLRREVKQVAAKLGVRRLRAITLPGIGGPVAFGLFRPTVGLPVSFADEFQRDQRLAILAHEVAHLRGHDPAWRLLSDLTVALLWWQPLVWWSRNRLHVMSEAAADEASLAYSGRAELLADCLVQMGRRLASMPNLGWLAFAGERFRSDLGRRVCRLLQLESKPRQPGPRWRLAAARIVGPAWLLSTVVFCTAWARPQVIPAEGENTMNMFRASWRQSLTAVALSSLLAAGGEARADDQITETAAADEIVLNLLQDAEDAERQERAGREEEEREHAEREAHEAREAEEREAQEGREAEEREAQEGREAEEREFAEHLRRLHDEIRELLEGGHEAQARELEAHARQLHQQHHQRVLEEHVNRLQRQIERNLEAGHERAAEQIERQLREVIQRHERDQGRARHEAEIAELNQRLEDIRREHDELVENGHEDRARQMAQEAREIEQALRQALRVADSRREGQPRPTRGRRSEVQRRIELLEHAAHNLREAGLEDRADEILQAAERIAHEHENRPDGESPEARRDRRRHDEARHASVEQLRHELLEMRREIEHLHAMLRELMASQEADQDRRRERDRERGSDRERIPGRERDRDAPRQ